MSLVIAASKVKTFCQGLTAILSRKNSVLAVYFRHSFRVLIYLANAVLANGNQLFKLKMHNDVLSYCSTMVVQEALSLVSSAC